MPIQKRSAIFGITKQTTKGVAATEATYGFATLGGSLLVVAIDQEPDPISFSAYQRISSDENRLGANPGGTLRTRAYPRSIGLLLYGALGAIASSGTGPYTHTITPAATLPYFTIFTRFGSDNARISDSKIDTLRLSWNERAPLEVEATFMGTTAGLVASAWNITNDERGQERFVPPGGTFKVDAGSSTPAVAKVSGGEVTISNGLVGIPLSASTAPDDIYEGEQTIEVSLTLIPDDFTEWRKAVTGSGGGSIPSNGPVYGSFEVRFVIDANTSLKLAASRVAFLPDFPEADPAGGPVELVLPGRVKHPSSGYALTATLMNSVPSY